MSVQKAWLEVEPQAGIGEGGRLTCLFNPTQLELGKSNSWQANSSAGRSAPELSFGGGSAGTLSLDLQFDTTETGAAVTSHTDLLLELMRVNKQLPVYDESTGSGRPPWVKFHWGDWHSFKAVLESLDLSFTYFASSGVPLRARASIRLRQFEDDPTWPRQNPTSGTPFPHRLHQIQVGETLDRIAARHFGDSTRWRDIASANQIIDPLNLDPGTLLVIPARGKAV